MTLTDDVFAWISGLPPWQQELARRLARVSDLNEREFRETSEVIQRHFGIQDDDIEPTPIAPFTRGELRQSEMTGAPRISSFGKLVGVGVARPDQALEFAEQGLTVVYGPNATGKSTYVRALKRVSKTVDRDTRLRSNVFKEQPPKQSAELTIRHPASDNLEVVQCDLSSTEEHTPLDTASVFDAECAELYVDSQNTVTFVPSDLLLLARLATTQDRLRGEFDRKADRIIAQRPRLDGFPPDSLGKSLIDSLSTSTRLSGIEQAAQLNQEEEQRIIDLRAILASREADSAREDGRTAQSEAEATRRLSVSLSALTRTCSKDEFEAYAALRSNNELAQEAARLARFERSDMAIDIASNSPWRVMWEAARSYATSAGSNFPTNTGEYCPLCTQPVSEEASARMHRFEDHVASQLELAATRARTAVDEWRREFDTALESVRQAPGLAVLENRDPKLHENVSGYMTAARETVREIDSGSYPDSQLLLPTPPVEALNSWSTARDSRAAELFRAASDDSAEELQKELRDLESRALLRERIGEVKTWVEQTAKAEQVRSAYRALATNKITTKQRELSESSVSEGLQDQLVSEMRGLRCQLPVKLHPVTRVGETSVSLQLVGLDTAPPLSKIASEGEQRALALAFFFAEMASSHGDGAMIVDDPVSSLDDERRDYIADRLVLESQQRQVIVFTHDLPFMLSLQEQYEKKVGTEPAVQSVWRLGETVGRVDANPPFKSMKIKARIGALKQEVQEWDKKPEPESLDEAWLRVSSFYDRLRKSWERAVEEVLFKGTVQRFQREIKTLSLDQVRIGPEDVATVREGMTRCSTFVHDEPSTTSMELPVRATLEADLNKLTAFVQSKAANK